MALYPNGRGNRLKSDKVWVRIPGEPPQTPKWSNTMSYPAPMGYTWRLLPVQHHGYLNKSIEIGGIVYDESHLHPIYTYGWVLTKDTKNACI